MTITSPWAKLTVESTSAKLRAASSMLRTREPAVASA